MAKRLEGEYTQACLEKEKRPDLLLVAKHYYLDAPTAGNSQYQTKADIVKSIMCYWANHALLDSGELDRLERSFESPTAVPLSKGMTTEQLAWEKVIMVQSALKSRAQKCFNLLHENKGYAELKRLVLRKCELRPESYRLKFRKNRKLSDLETYVDYLRATKLDVDKWLDSRNIKDEYFKFYDLILLEEFTHG